MENADANSLFLNFLPRFLLASKVDILGILAGLQSSEGGIEFEFRAFSSEVKMGKGRKTGTLLEKLNEDIWARNLPPAAEIFGDKNHTVNESLDKEIFGLPAAHYSYWDRMLGGIISAVSSGQMNISRHSRTTAEGAEIMPYPAQFATKQPHTQEKKGRLKCCPLPEEKIKPLIKNNYYEEMYNSSVTETADEEFNNLDSKEYFGNAEMLQEERNEQLVDFVECWEDCTFVDNFLNETYKNEVWCSQYHNRESDMTEFTNLPSSENTLEGEDEKPAQVLVESNGVRDNSALAPLENCEKGHVHPNFTDMAFQKENSAASEWSKVSQLEQGIQIQNLQQELVDSKLETNQLSRCDELEPMSSSARDYYNPEYPSISNFTAEESVYIIGGHDGDSWLSDLSLYSPSKDCISSLCTMTSSRPRSCVVKLNGELYIIGGVFGYSAYDIVESYNPINGQWIQRPSLNRKKGSLSGASINGKIFAIGGGNGHEHFNDVEIFDPYIGSWVYSQPMFDKRFSPSAAELNGAIYVSGGDDGSRLYLRTAERFDPREEAWTRLADMKFNRAGHSLVPYKEKLYAIGGYTGNQMLSSVEVLDPRFGPWIPVEPMKTCRSYFGSFIMGEKIYAIGGLEDEEVLDFAECYTEESKWEMTRTTALGTRSLFSTIVL